MQASVVSTSLALLAAVALAGCAGLGFGGTYVDCSEYLPQNPGEAVLEVVVLDEPRGPALAGADVQIETSGLCWRENDRADTFENGTARFVTRHSVNANVVVMLNGHTRETARDVVLGGPGSSTRIEVPLYREYLTHAIEGRYDGVGPGADPVGLQQPRWEPIEATWDDDPETLRGYAQRILSLRAVMSWNNSLTSFADLGIGMGIGPGAPEVVVDAGGDQLGAGSHTEAIDLSAEAMYRAGWADASTLYAGALTYRPHATLDGIPYVIAIEGRFGEPRDADAPLAGWVAAAALVGAALLARRVGRRR